ncbi:MAG: hypothetical protein HN370_02500 [Phycisphaerales bacterium]|nr:hypothetical protein [Phycisphaerales bacterium]
MRSAIRLATLCFSLAVSFAAPSAEAVEPKAFATVTVKGVNKAGKAIDYAYRLLRPAKIDPKKRYPLIVFLHGMGERGSDNVRHLGHAAKHLPEAFLAKSPCFVLCPQCPKDDVWSKIPRAGRRVGAVKPGELLTAEPTAAMKNAMAAIKKTVATEQIHTDTISLTGLSMGGFGSWDLAMRQPGWFSAVAPICGGGDPKYADRLLGMAVWSVHGGADPVVPARLSQTMNTTLTALGHPRNKYTELPGVGHNSWDTAYGKLGVFAWLLEHKNTLAEGELAGALALAAPTTPLEPNEKILFLGDTITLNGGSETGFVTLLNQTLATRKKTRQAKLEVVGGSGHMSNHLYKRFEADILAKNPTMVVIYTGTYDAWGSTMDRAPDQAHYRKWLGVMLDRCRKRSISVVLATPAVMGEYHKKTNKRDALIDSYAKINRELAKEYGATLCDLRKEFRDRLPIHNPADRQLGAFTRDMIKMNTRGHRLLADCFGQAITQAAHTRFAASQSKLSTKTPPTPKKEK